MPDVDLQERPPKAGKSRRAALPPAAAEDGAPQAQPSGVMRRIVLTSPKGGSGKTGTTRNLAVAAAMDGYKVATVDLDPQRSLTRWFEKRPDQATFIQHHEAHMRDVRAVLDEVSGFDLVLFDTPTAV